MEVNGYEIEPGADLYGANLDNVDLRGADLSNVNLTNATLWGADLAGANLAGADLTNAGFGDANFTNATVTDAEFAWAELNGANFTNAKLGGVNFGPPEDVLHTMINCGFLDDRLDYHDEVSAYAVKARFGLLDGEPKSFMEIGDDLGVTAEAARRIVGRCVAELISDPIGAELAGANFTNADLTGANFTNADLTGANFTNANLANANLAGAKLTGATMPDGTKHA